MKAILSKEGGGYDLYRIDEDGKRVTFASTQDYKQKLSIKNCQAIELGYDLDELANRAFDYMGYHSTVTPYEEKQFKLGYRVAFREALEILGDKKFSEEDIIDCWETAHQAGRFEEKGIAETNWQTAINYAQELQQKEWEVEIVTESKNKGFTPKRKVEEIEIPKLDADGCLILKRVI